MSDCYLFAEAERIVVAFAVLLPCGAQVPVELLHHRGGRGGGQPELLRGFRDALCPLGEQVALVDHGEAGLGAELGGFGLGQHGARVGWVVVLLSALLLVDVRVDVAG